MIAHAFDILRAKDEMNAEGDGAGILHHVREQLSKEGRVQAVNILVACPDIDGFCHIAVGETIQHIPELAQHQSRYVPHSAHRPPRHLFAIDGADAFADVLCEIADPLKLVCDPQDSDDLAQIDSYRLTPRNRLHGSFLDCALHGIDRRIGGDHPPPAFRVSIAQRPDRLHDLSFDQAAHFRDSTKESL
jgi:hypothetical protein